MPIPHPRSHLQVHLVNSKYIVVMVNRPSLPPDLSLEQFPPQHICVQTSLCKSSYLGTFVYVGEFRVEVGHVWELIHHYVRNVIQHGVLLNVVLDVRDLGEELKMKRLVLEKKERGGDESSRKRERERLN